MIDIYSISGIVLARVPISSEAVIHEELMASDYIKLSWVAESNAELPAGSYIEYNGERYSLLAPYRPTSLDEAHYDYEPEFSSRVMLWDKTPACIYTYDWDGYTLRSREFEWNFVGTPSDALFAITQSIYNETGERWSYEVAEGLPASISLNVSNNSIFAVLSNLAEACETEWWADKANNVLHLSKCERFADMPLEVGVHVGTPSISANNEGYYSRFYALGSTRNIVEETVIADSIAQPVNKRLTLDPKKYPDGYKDIAGHFEDGVYVSDLKKGEIFAKTLVFEEIFPSSHLTIASARKRLKYRLKDGEKIKIGEDTASNPIYEQYAIWYFKIEGFEFTEDLIIEGKTLSVNFKTGKLAGREFELHYHDKADSEHFSDDVEPFEVEAGDYEIIIDESEGTILPSVDYIIPEAGDKIILFNINMPAEYTDAAQIDLENALDKEIAKLLKDNNNYELESYPYAFQKNALNLELGRKVLFKYGGHEFLTRVLMVEKNLDCEYQQKVRLGNQMIKGSRQQLKDEIRNVGEEVAALKEQEKVLVSLQRDYAQSLRNTVASYLGLKDTISLLQGAFDGFSEGANPVTVETMLVMLGDNSLQYRIVNNIVELVPLTNPITYDSASRHLNVAESAIVHYTLGINDIQPSSSRDVSQYLKWYMPAFTSGVLNDADVQYYLFARVPKGGEIGEYKLVSKSQFDDNKIELESEEGYYNLLVGILNKEYSGAREFVRMYGYTAVGAGQISTDVIKSSDGQTYFDLVNGEIGGVIKFAAGSSGLENIDGLTEAIQNSVGGLEFGKYNLLRNSGFTGDFVTESLDNKTILDKDSQMFSDPLTHWTASNVSVQDSEVGQSGKEVILSNGILSQTLKDKVIVGENYVLTFRAKGQRLSYSIGGVSGSENLSSEWQKYIIKFKAESSESVFSISNATAIICDLQLERGTVQSAWGHSMYDNQSELAMYQALDYIKSAIKDGSSTVLGGLILSNLIMLGNIGKQDNTAGISGIYNNDDDVAFWGGGTYAQAIDTVMKYVEDPTYQPTTEELANMAKAVITHGGRAILNDVIVRGKVYAEEGNIGGFEITRNRIGHANEGLSLSTSYLAYRDTDDDTSATRFSAIGENVLPSTMGIYGLSRFEIESSDSFDKDFGSAIGVYSSIKGYKRPYAFYCPKGQFAGLRPRFRRIVCPATEKLEKIDHTLEVFGVNGNACTLTLPTGPEDGQIYEILKWGNSALTIKAPDTNIVRLGVAAQPSQEIGTDFVGIIRIVFSKGADNQWLMALCRTE